MNTPTSIYQPAYQAPNQTFVWAVVISIVLHLFAVLYLPNFETKPAQTLPEVLNIEIEAPKAPEPVASPVVESEPVPEPPKPKKIQPKIEPKVIPTPKPAPIETYEPPTPSQKPADEPPAPPVMAVEPAKNPTPVFTAPPPPPPEPTGPSQADLDAARRGYADRLARAIAQHKQYPRIAQMRSWQGEALVDLKLDGNGAVLATRIERSSGFEVLDKQALEMVKKAAPFPAPPDILKGNVFNIQVPVSFKLE